MDELERKRLRQLAESWLDPNITWETAINEELLALGVLELLDESEKTQRVINELLEELKKLQT